MANKVLMLSPVTAGPEGKSLGSVEITATCGHQCWISPQGVQMLLGGGIDTFCWNCIDTEHNVYGGPVPGARDAIASVLGSEVADATLARANRDPEGMVRHLRRHAPESGKKKSP